MVAETARGRTTSAAWLWWEVARNRVRTPRCSMAAIVRLALAGLSASCQVFQSQLSSHVAKPR